MNIERVVSKVFDENCYIVSNSKKNAIIIDPGAGVLDKVNKTIAENSLNLQGIILTHGHFDHIWDVPLIQRDAQQNGNKSIKILAHKNDKEFCHNALLVVDSSIKDRKNVAYQINKTIKRDIDYVPILLEVNFLDIDSYKSKVVKLGDFTFTIYSTPGHSAGSIILQIDNILFTGDTVFKNSYGRVDLYLSDPAKMKKSLELFKTFDPELKVLPGHYAKTNVKDWVKYYAEI